MILICVLIVIGNSYTFQQQTTLLDNSQYHYIPPEAYLSMMFSTDNILKNDYPQAELLSQINISKSSYNSTEPYTFDFLTFTNITAVSQQQYECYLNAINLGIYNISNCSMSCNKCSEVCINQCINQQGSCCCSDCNQTSYSLIPLSNAEITSIQEMQLLMVLDNSNMFGPYNQNLSAIGMIIAYSINITVNKQYKILTFIIVGLFSFVVIVLLITCACINSKLTQANLQIEQEAKE